MQVMGYELRINNGTLLTFENSHHAEQTLRALVHSGYAVTITEKPISLTTQQEINVKWHQMQEKTDSGRKVRLGDMSVDVPYPNGICELQEGEITDGI